MMGKITLFLMTKKGLKVLNSALEYLELIDSVIIGRDSNVKNDYSDEIKNVCIQNNIRFFYRNDNYTITSEYCLSVSWKWLLDNKHRKLIVFHDSLLPKYRGFAPLVNMLINKEEYFGVTALFAQEEYDRGDIIYQKKIKVQYPITIECVIDLISELYSDLAVKVFKNIGSNTPLLSYSQDETEASYSLWRGEDDYRLDWSKSSSDIKRFVDAVSFPFKGAFSLVDKRYVRILEVKIVEDLIIENRDPGKVIFVNEGNPIVVCGEGLIMIKLMKDEAGNRLDFKDFKFRTWFK